MRAWAARAQRRTTARSDRQRARRTPTRGSRSTPHRSTWLPRSPERRRRGRASRSQSPTGERSARGRRSLVQRDVDVDRRVEAASRPGRAGSITTSISAQLSRSVPPTAAAASTCSSSSSGSPSTAGSARRYRHALVPRVSRRPRPRAAPRAGPRRARRASPAAAPRLALRADGDRTGRARSGARRARRSARCSVPPPRPRRRRGRLRGGAPRARRSSAPRSRLAQAAHEIGEVRLEHPWLCDGLERGHAPLGELPPADAIRQPASSGTNSSVGPPAVAMTGRPQAIASSAGMQKPSPR